MSDVTDRIVRALAERPGRALEEGRGGRRAAVAAILRRRAEGPELLFIRRAVDDRDPWSGHMAFPGGMKDPGDRTIEDTVRREVAEEVAVDLDADTTLAGRLDDVQGVARGRVLPLVITPFVHVAVRDLATTPNYEVAEIVWVPVSYLADSANDETIEMESPDGPLHLPAWRFEGRTIWGLTQRMVGNLLEVAAMRC